METQKIKLSEVRQLVRNILKEEKLNKKFIKEDLEDDLIEFTIPEWAMPVLINGDYSGLSDEDEAKIDEFVNDTVKEFGNANFMDGDEDLGFLRSNDIDNLGSNCYKLVLKPSKMQESVKPKTQKIKLSEVRQLVRKSLKENKLNTFYVVFDGTSHVVLDEYDYKDFIKKEPKQYHKILFKSNNEDKAFNKAEELDETSEPMQESVKPKTQKIKLSEVRESVRKMLKEGSEDDSNLALYNIKSNEIFSRGLTPDIIDYLMYKKKYVKRDYLKVIKDPLENEVEVQEDGSLKFKPNYKPKFLDLDYETEISESVKPKTQKIKLSEVRGLVKSMLKEDPKKKNNGLA
jgi:hypothetical protein